jgi:hypothetical protein
MITCEASDRLQPLIMPSITWAWRAFVLHDNDNLQHGERTSTVHSFNYSVHQLSALFSSKSGIAQEGFHAVIILVRNTDTKLWQWWLSSDITNHVVSGSPFRRQYCLHPLGRKYAKKEMSSIFSCSLFLTSTRPHPASYKMGTGVLSPVVKRREREAGHSSPSNAKIKNGGATPPVPHISSRRGA